MSSKITLVVTARFKILIVVDTHGNAQAEPVADTADTLQIWEVKDAAGKDLYFESEAYHLPSWCEENGLQYLEFDREEKFDVIVKVEAQPL